MGGFYRYGRAKDPDKELEKLRKKNPDVSPVLLPDKKIAKKWWGISWNQNLERYADFENRLSRGRTYLRKGMVLDLKITGGTINALVCGSESKPYAVKVGVSPYPQEKMDALLTKIIQVKEIAALLEGDFPEEVAEQFFEVGAGLFPTPEEIDFSCTCPDGALMCKHVAATLYGVGHRLDENPLLFFQMREIEMEILIKKSASDRTESLLANAKRKTKRTLPLKDIGEIFGI